MRANHRPDRAHVGRRRQGLAQRVVDELIIGPDNNFLATCGRFGSITCEGSPAVGYFWSAALGWPLVWDQDDETAISALDGTGPFITWGPSAPAATVSSRLHLDLAPAGSSD